MVNLQSLTTQISNVEADFLCAAQLGTQDSPCKFEKGKCYKLIYHPT